MTTTITPRGQAPPAEIVDGSHHGAYISIATAMGLVVVLLCLLIRLYIGFTMRPLSRPADVFLFLAAVCGTAQSGIIFYAIEAGLGTSITLISSTALIHIQKVRWYLIHSA